MSAADRASFDPTKNSFVGLAIGQLIMATFGALAITSEFSSGMIRATLAAVPDRPLLLAAKAAVVGAVALAAGEILAFAGFLAGQAAVASPAPHATLGQPGVLRAVLMAGAYLCVIALIGLGLGAIIRHTAGAIGAAVVAHLRAAAGVAAAADLGAARHGEVPARADRGELADRGQAGHLGPVAVGRARHALPVHGLALASAAGRWPNEMPELRRRRTIRPMDEELRRVAGIVRGAPLTRRNGP